MIRPFGESALLVEVGSAVRAQQLALSFQRRPIAGVVEVVPALESVLVELDSLGAAPNAVARSIEERLLAVPDTPLEGRRLTIPVRYGEDAGPDLPDVAALTGLTEDEVVRLHAATELTVLFIGFAPGFAYLGGLPEALQVSRLATPRTRTPAGSVAIAESMSGIYPADLPGGWRVIGRTEVELFDPRRDPPALLAPGDIVRFVPS